MFSEEQSLRRKFGETFVDRAEKSPAFIPRFSWYQKAELPFSWKKVLKKEKIGLVAVSIFFCTGYNRCPDQKGKRLQLVPDFRMPCKQCYKVTIPFQVKS